MIMPGIGAVVAATKGLASERKAKSQGKENKMRYPRNQTQQPMYYPQRGSGGLKAIAIVLGILCGALFIAVLALAFQLTDKSDEVASKIDIINQRNIEIDKLKTGIDRKREETLAQYTTGGQSAPPVDENSRNWYEKCKKLEADLAASVEQMQFYKNLIPTETLEKNEQVFVSEANLEEGTDSLYMTMVLVNRTDKTANNVRGTLFIFNNNLIAKQIPFTAPVLKPNSQTVYKMPPIPNVPHSHFNIQLLAGTKPYDTEN